MGKAENNYDDAVSRLRIATADILKDHPEYLEIIKGSASTKRTAVAEIARITTLVILGWLAFVVIGLGGWLSWSDAFIKWFELHTDFRIVHKDVSENRLAPIALTAEMVDGMTEELWDFNGEPVQAVRHDVLKSKLEESR